MHRRLDGGAGPGSRSWTGLYTSRDVRRTSLVCGGATLAVPGVTQVGAPAPAVDWPEDPAFIEQAQKVSKVIAFKGPDAFWPFQAPMPFSGPDDVVTRLLVEQWVTFPRFVFSGGWYRNLRHAS